VLTTEIEVYGDKILVEFELDTAPYFLDPDQRERPYVVQWKVLEVNSLKVKDSKFYKRLYDKPGVEEKILRSYFTGDSY